MMSKKKNPTMFVAMVGVMGALVFAASHISFRLPAIAGTNPRIHFGNIMCLLSGLILGPAAGGISAGVGSLFFDLTSDYVTSAPFTLVFKFLMAFVCGKIAWSKDAQAKSFRRNLVAGILGQLTYIVLYLGKDLITNLYFHRVEVQTALLSVAQKGFFSTINGVIAVICAVPLSFALRKGLRQANLHGLQDIH